MCEFLGEEPLLIRIDGKPYSVVMRTPGEELVHAAGFCLGEGIADSPDDFAAIGYCEDLDPNVIEVRLKPERREKIRDLLERKSFVSQTSCGICGKEMVADIYQVVAPTADPFQVSIDQVLKCIDRLAEKQVIHRRTRGAHAAMLIDRRLEMVSFAEDVGRHNALDKAIGKAFVARRLSEAVLLILSSRISYEMVQKAARAKIPIVVGMSRPTALAAEMGRALNMTLACTARQSELIIVCGEGRLISDSD
ncbi:MAG: formate dehydrogenase accessory sulfurtransferase FdhD [Desulfobacterales bacterium]